MDRFPRTLLTGAAGVGRRAFRYMQFAAIAMRTRLGGDRHVPNLLSVIVPAHNVERYIDESLQSLRRGSYLAVQIIVVDDGSSDGSARVADRHRRRDPRVRIVRRPNGGPSAARNTGVREARGEFLAFLDPDDLVSRDGYADAIATLKETGSDFVVMSYDRLEHGRRRRPGPWISEAHGTRRLRRTIDDAPDIQVNAVVWSKVYRKAFYERAGLEYPEGAIYEDQPVSARAYARAASFDILPDVLVTWRIREDGTSITQQTSTAANLTQHNQAVRASLAELEGAGRPQAAAARALQLLANNMRLFTRHVDDADDDFWRVLRIGLQELVDRVSHADYVREVPAQEKVLNLFILRDDRAQAAAFITAGGMRLTDFPTHRAPEGHVVELPFIDDPDAEVPADCFILADRQLSVNSSITGLRWTDDTTLGVDGWAYIRNIDLSEAPPTLGVHAIGSGGGRLDLAVEMRQCSGPNRASQHRHCDYRNGCFSARLDASALAATTETWHLEVELTVAGVTRSAVLKASSSLERTERGGRGHVALSRGTVRGTATVLLGRHQGARSPRPDRAG